MKIISLQSAPSVEIDAISGARLRNVKAIDITDECRAIGPNGRTVSIYYDRCMSGFRIRIFFAWGLPGTYTILGTFMPGVHTASSWITESASPHLSMMCEDAGIGVQNFLSFVMREMPLFSKTDSLVHLRAFYPPDHEPSADDYAFVAGLQIRWDEIHPENCISMQNN